MYLFLSLFYYPIRYIFDPTYSIPRELLRELYRRVKDTNWDVDKITGIFKISRRRLIKRHKIHVLGHVHTHYVEEKPDMVLIHTDTWRDEYYLAEGSKTLLPKVKRYLQIQFDDDQLHWDMKEIDLKQNSYDVSDVIKDEIGFIKKAAKKEGFTLNLI